jgi:hypothetical protein
MRRITAITRRHRRSAYEVHRNGDENVKGLDLNGLVSYALYAPMAEDRMAALERIDDEKALGHIATGSLSNNTRLEAVKKINDTRILKEIISLTDDKHVRNAAIDRVIAIEDDPLRG